MSILRSSQKWPIAIFPIGGIILGMLTATPFIVLIEKTLGQKAMIEAEREAAFTRLIDDVRDLKAQAAKTQATLDRIITLTEQQQQAIEQIRNRRP